MNKNMKQISKEIREGKMLEKNIPTLFNILAEKYHTFADVRLAMHYFAFYEAYTDDEGTWSAASLEIIDKVNRIIHDNVLNSNSGMDREAAIQEVDQIRNRIMEHMSAITKYIDIFQIYEYVLNRVEYRFSDKVVTFDEEEFSKEILRYIFDTEDSVVINEKIKDIIGQLPIRLTKQKYFEILKGSIQAYLGADAASLDSYLYMLKTSAMLHSEDGMESLYPTLWEKKTELSKLSLKDITKEDYDKAIGLLHAASLTLEIETTVFFGLQEIVNEVYAILLCGPYAGMIEGTTLADKAASTILRKINEYFINHDKKELSDQLVDKFHNIEGVQEELSLDITSLEDSLYEVNVNHKALTESLMLNQFLNILLRTKDLLSNSLFIDLHAAKRDEIVDEEKVEKEVKALEEALTNLFNKHDRMIARAVMANTINKMPVFFIDHTEVMEYVMYSLQRCSDIYEKAACYELINDIMNA